MTEAWTYSEEAERICGSVAALHLQLRELETCLAGMPYNMVWKRSGAREYLYRVHDRKGNGASLGRRSSETEDIHRRFLGERAAAQLLIADTESRIAEAARIYRALSLPMLSPAISRVLDAFEAWDIDYWAIGSVGVMAVSTLLGLHVDVDSMPEGTEDVAMDLDLVIHPSQVERVDGMFPDMTQIWTGGDTPRITFRDRRSAIDIIWPTGLVEIFSRGANTVQVLVTRDLRTAAVRIPEAGALMTHHMESRSGRRVVPAWLQDIHAAANGRARSYPGGPSSEGGGASAAGPQLSHEEARRLMAPRIRSLRSAHGGNPGPHALEIIAGRGAPPPPANGNDTELPTDWHRYMERTA